MLNTKLIFKEILNNLITTIEMETPKQFARMSTSPFKRNVNNVSDFNSIEPKSKKPVPQIVETGSVATKIKHFVIDKSNFNLNEEQVSSLFKLIRIMVLDNEADRNNNSSPHYHILGEAKVGIRQIRDMSIANLRAMDIKGGLEAKAFFLTARVKNIGSELHFKNTVNYLKKKGNVIREDESVLFSPPISPIWTFIDEAEEPAKFSKEDMAEFRHRFPIINSWKKPAAQKKYSKFIVDKLQEMESQRKYEDNIRELTDEEKHLLLPNVPIVSHAENLRNQLINHDQNSGVCLILCGGALMCKSTINRIIASSLGEYAIWPGSQWIQRDALKFDSAARQGISTIVVEEMQWIDIQHRITLEKTLNSIKEQLTGAGLDVRLAKTKTSLQDDIKFKMEYLLISMNETEYVNYRTLAHMINSKPEFKRRFLLINMDDPKYSDIAVCRNRPNNNWIGNETQMEWLAGKAIKNKPAFQELVGLHDEMIWRQQEVAELMRLLEENEVNFDSKENSIVEISEEEAIMEDCHMVMERMKKEIEENF